jgi:hypothetical protein
MANYWIRELPTYHLSTSDFGIYVQFKLVSIFLKEVLGWTYQSQLAQTVGTSWTSYEKSGTTGQFDGSSWILNDTSNLFSSSDTNKYIIIGDPSNPRNCGAYLIKNYISISSIVIDFRAEQNEYPTASSANIKWFIVGATYQMPNYFGDYVRYKSPHISEYAVEYGVGGYSNYRWATIKVCVDGNWAGGKILSGDYGLFLLGMDNNKYFGNFLFEDGGRYIYNLFRYERYSYSGQSIDNQNIYNGSIVSFLDSVGETKPDIDRVALCCRNHPYTGSGPGLLSNSVNFSRATNATASGGPYYDITVAYTQVWSSNRNAIKTGHMVDYSASGYANSFVNLSDRENNARSGYKIDCLYGTPIMIDWDNTDLSYNMAGIVPGHYTIRNMAGKANQIVSSDGINKDRLYLSNGFVIDWPGTTPQT